MPTVGFGIVGCGMIAHFHARAIAELHGAKLRAVFTTNPAHGDSVAKSAGYAVDIHNRLEDLLARSDVDIVNICTPSGAHLEPGLAAARAGKHVVVEKPLEVTLKRCDRLIDACRRANVQLCTIFPSRFSDANIELKKAVDAGRFGRLTLGDTTVKWWRTQEYYDSGGWRGTWQLDGGGALMNQAIHNVDLLQFMMGPVERVAAFTALLAHERIEVEDTAVAALRFENGSLGMIEATTSAHPGLLKTIGIHGDAGSAVVDQDDVLVWSFVKGERNDAAILDRLGRRTGQTGGASDPKAISHLGHSRQLADFVHSVRTSSRSKVDGAEGRRSVEIILAIYQAQATGKVVQLPLARDPNLSKLQSAFRSRR